MPTLQDLLDELGERDVRPRELMLTGRELRILTQRADAIIDADGEPDGEEEDGD